VAHDRAGLGRAAADDRGRHARLAPVQLLVHGRARDRQAAEPVRLGHAGPPPADDPGHQPDEVRERQAVLVLPPGLAAEQVVQPRGRQQAFERRAGGDAQRGSLGEPAEQVGEHPCSSIG
jgi:hypothetical protein